MYKKSFIPVLLFIFITTALFSQVAMPELGDVNYEGGATIVDALLVAQYYIGLSPSPFFTTAADVNCNITIDIIDALLIAQWYVGLINSFDGCTGADIITGYGEVTYIEIEGGCIAIETDEGSYEPLGLPEGIDIGMQIIFRARLRPDMSSICMVGTIIEIFQADQFF